MTNPEIITYLTPHAITMCICILLMLPQFRAEMMEQGRWF